ncbi:hypothetical protein R1flu_019903 [Riccia fluitans]|uniref:Uncharacterized protein n=1 Tax=Riccia fluitans TaxID=41844 RepID=A0ABD1ZKB3_9MARC
MARGRQEVPGPEIAEPSFDLDAFGMCPLVGPAFVTLRVYACTDSLGDCGAISEVRYGLRCRDGQAPGFHESLVAPRTSDHGDRAITGRLWLGHGPVALSIWEVARIRCFNHLAPLLASLHILPSW